jgi:hypothetical protein
MEFRFRFRIWIWIQNKMEYLQKLNTVKESKWDDNFLGHNAASNFKKARFCKKIFYCSKYGMDPVPDLDQNQNFSKVRPNRIRQNSVPVLV